MSKYADDIILLIPSSASALRDDEIRHVEEWAGKRNLRLNKGKSAEMVITTRGVNSRDLPPAPTGIARVKEMVILGVTISDDLRISKHLAKIIPDSEKSLYALRIMKSHGMKQAAIQSVFRSVTLAKLTYCSQAWYGFTKSDDRQRLEGFLRRCKRFGYCDPNCPTFEELCTTADNVLFMSVLTSSCPHNLLPNKREILYHLRPRRHDRLQPTSDRYTDNNFMSRMLKLNCCI